MSETEFTKAVRELIEAGKWLSNDIALTHQNKDGISYAQYKWGQARDKVITMIHRVELEQEQK